MTSRASLDLTHVLYDSESHASLAMALVTLSPILLMPAYASLAVFTREFLVIEMWIGQFACEGANWVLKRLIKQERPHDSAGTGYGFPSSHSQYMGYFATFLICHLHFRHRFESFGHPLLDVLWRLALNVLLVSWAGCVCYSRYHLTYHTAAQIAWGAFFGVFLGFAYYTVCELIPSRYPQSLLGQLRAQILDNPIVKYLRIRDGWAVWPDGGNEFEWRVWRGKWEEKTGGVRVEPIVGRRISGRRKEL